MTDTHYQPTVHHDAWHYMLRLITKVRSWIHHRRLIVQFAQTNLSIPKESPFGVLKGTGRFVDLDRRHPTKRGWIDIRGNTVRSCAFERIENMKDCGY